MGDKITQEEALKMVNEILFAAQKMRSNALESLGDGTGQRVLEFLMPTLFREEKDGEYNVVGALMRYANKAEKDGYITKGDFLNMLTIANREPALAIIYALLGEGKELPEPMDGFKRLDVTGVPDGIF